MLQPSPLNIAPLSRNERMILEIVRRREPITRAAITPHTNLTQQSVHRIVEDLAAAGLLIEGEPTRGARGQPSPNMLLARQARYALGMSVNTDNATLCLSDMSCRVVEEVHIRIPPLSRDQTLVAARDVADRLLQRHGVARAQLVGMGVGMSGFFTANLQQVNAPEPLRDWSLIDLEPIFAATFDLPIRIQNNATTAAIAESLRGVGLRMDSFGYLSFNYGFGGGIVLNGQPLLGSHGNAGEISGIYDPDESRNRPALRGLLDDLRHRGVAVDSIEDLRQRFDPDWPGVAEWVERVLPATDRLINALAAIIDPQAIVFGGQIPHLLAKMLIAKAKYWGRHRYGVGPERPALLLSEVPGDAAAAGAAILPLREAFFI